MTDPRIEAATKAIQEAMIKRGISPDAEALAKAALAAAVSWRPMSEAPKDRTPILAKMRSDIYPESSNRSGWNGRHVVIRHEGILDDGFDMGWSVAAPVGYGGMPDEWFLGWQPLPAPPVVDVGGDDE
ncbi:MAG: hypothetical protein ABF751_09770 [Acetobacter orientalis]|uniref:hypothetical protein n=1 Tax=Acetobacter orientalis TaxID=146474 RepID=UPI0039EAE79B